MAAVEAIIVTVMRMTIIIPICRPRMVHPPVVVQPVSQDGSNGVAGLCRHPNQRSDTVRQ